MSAHRWVSLVGAHVDGVTVVRLGCRCGWSVATTSIEKALDALAEHALSSPNPVDNVNTTR